MLHECQTRLEFPYDAAANDAAAKASEGRVLAAAAARQRETDLIMEALLREYLNSPQRRN
jgi:hypothetical protein